MIRRTETGEYLLTPDKEGVPPNNLRPYDAKEKARQEANKRELLKKL